MLKIDERKMALMVLIVSAMLLIPLLGHAGHGGGMHDTTNYSYYSYPSSYYSSYPRTYYSYPGNYYNYPTYYSYDNDSGHGGCCGHDDYDYSYLYNDGRVVSAYGLSPFSNSTLYNYPYSYGNSLVSPWGIGNYNLGGLYNQNTYGLGSLYGYPWNSWI